MLLEVAVKGPVGIFHSMLLKTLSFFCFWNFWACNISFSSICFLLECDRPLMSAPPVPLRSYSWDDSNLTCSLKGPSASLRGVGPYLSAGLALSFCLFLLLFWPRHFVFLTSSSWVCLSGSLRVSDTMLRESIVSKHTIFKQVLSGFTFLSYSNPLRRDALLRSMTDSGLTWTIFTCLAPWRMSYMPCASPVGETPIPWISLGSSTWHRQFPAFLPVRTDNRTRFQVMTHRLENFIFSGLVIHIYANIVQFSQSSKELTQLLLFGENNLQCYRDTPPIASPKSRTAGNISPISAGDEWSLISEQTHSNLFIRKRVGWIFFSVHS